jgi:hypothetical protein
MEPPDLGPNQPIHVVTKPPKHQPNLTIQSLGQNNFSLGAEQLMTGNGLGKAGLNHEPLFHFTRIGLL